MKGAGRRKSDQLSYPSTPSRLLLALLCSRNPSALHNEECPRKLGDTLRLLRLIYDLAVADGHLYAHV